MRKITLFLALMVAMVTTAFAQTKVTSLDQLSNDAVYTITPANGLTLCVNSADLSKLYIPSRAAGTGTGTLPEANKQFAIFNVEGKYFLYNVVAKKFVKRNAPGTALTDDVTVANEMSIENSNATPDPGHGYVQADYPWCLKFEGWPLCTTDSNDWAGHGGVVANWNSNGDNGTVMCLETVDNADVDLTEALAKVQAYVNPQAPDTEDPVTEPLLEDGKAYTFTAVWGTTEIYVYNNNGTLALAARGTEDLPETAKFICEYDADAEYKYQFKTADGAYYFAYPSPGKAWLDNRSDTGLETVSSQVTKFNVNPIVPGGNVSATEAELEGLVKLDGYRGFNNGADKQCDEFGPIVIKHTAMTFDGASAPYYNNNFTSAFRIEETEIATVEPETPVLEGYRLSTVVGTDLSYLYINGTNVKLGTEDKAMTFLLNEQMGAYAVQLKDGGSIGVNGTSLVYDATNTRNYIFTVTPNTDETVALYYNGTPICVSMTGNIYLGGSATDTPAYWTREEVYSGGATQPEEFKVESWTPNTPVESISEITVTFNEPIQVDPTYEEPGAGTGAGTGTTYIYLGNRSQELFLTSIENNVLTLTAGQFAFTNVGEYNLIINEGRFVRADGTPVVITAEDNVKFTIKAPEAPKLNTTHFNTKNVKTLSQIVLKFDSEIVLATENAATEVFVYVKGTQDVAGKVTVSAETAVVAGTELTLVLDEPIAPQGQMDYTLDIPANLVVKASNNVAFAGAQIHGQLTQLLEIVHITPANGETLTTALENIVVEYNREVALNVGITLVNTADSKEYPCNAVVADDKKSVTVTPRENLPNGEYKVWVDSDPYKYSGLKGLVYAMPEGSLIGAEPEYTITINASEPLKPSLEEANYDQNMGLAGYTLQFKTVEGDKTVAIETTYEKVGDAYGYIYDAEDNVVLVLDGVDYWNGAYNFFNSKWNTIETPGDYRIEITAVITSTDGKVYNGGEYTFNIPVPEPVIYADYEYLEDVMNVVPLEYGVEITKAVVTVDDTKKVTYTTNGETYEAEVMAEVAEFAAFITIYFDEIPEVVGAEYTFTFPAGLYTVNGEANKEFVKTFKYERAKPIVLCDTDWNAIGTEFETIEKLYVIGYNYGYLTANEAEDAPKPYIVADVEGAVPVYPTVAFDNNAYTYALTFETAITELGTYTLVIPANTFVGVEENVEYTLTVVEGGGEVDEPTVTISEVVFGGENEIAYIHVIYSEVCMPAASGQIIVYDANDVEYTFVDSYADLPWNEVKYVPADGQAITAAGTYTVYGASLDVYFNNVFVSFEGQDYTKTIGEPSAIEGVDAEAEDAVIYDITGRRVEKITEEGIYIVNGKKVLVK